MDNFMNFFTLLILVCGVYCLYQAIYMCVTGKVPARCIVLSKDHPIENCLDPELFVSTIKIPFLICSIVLVVCSGIMVVHDFTGFLDVLTASLSNGVRILVLELFSAILPLAALIIFGVCLVRIQKRLW